MVGVEYNIPQFTHEIQEWSQIIGSVPSLLICPPTNNTPVVVHFTQNLSVSLFQNCLWNYTGVVCCIALFLSAVNGTEENISNHTTSLRSVSYHQIPSKERPNWDPQHHIGADVLSNMVFYSAMYKWVRLGTGCAVSTCREIKVHEAAPGSGVFRQNLMLHTLRYVLLSGMSLCTPMI